MEDLARPFDPYQTHQRHFDCVCARDSVQYLVSGKLEVLSQMQDTVFVSPKVPVRNSEGQLLEANVIGMRAGKENTRDNFPLAIQFLARASQTEEDINICSWYPVYDKGTDIDVTLTAIHEWANGMEATLEGTVLESARQMVFFDTRYAAKKLDYRIGETYTFKLAVFAYFVEMLDSPKMKLTAEQTEEFERKAGWKARRDANGNVKPMTIDMRDLVACVSRRGAQPDNCEYQSTIRGIDKEQFDIDEFIVLRIACVRDDDGKDIEFPMICRRDFFSRPWPRVGKCVRGILWMQGYCVEGVR